MSPRPRKLLTMSEVSRRTGISMPTLQKYKKEHQDRIPSEGEGRKQRYPLSALPVFQKLKEEGLARRGGGRKKSKAGKKKAGRPRSKAKARKASKTTGGESGLLSLQRIREITGISYPTLLRYVKLHLDRIPHVGEGRKRRYPEEAVEVFRQIRSESPRGRKPKGSAKKAKSRAGAGAGTADRNLTKKIAELQRSQSQLERQVRELKELIKRPITVTMRR